ncbi:12531_t:CDS:2 [Cetraspora pellucida]|uniref:12531_t:CDS:1 n=1 Tax=Cetraspora pellucida TaxID=1433469 RepID=A0ACA9M4W3_9GLOM|nr:12531_t:CDS:2 [Cetraspora pellucida]
MPGRLRLLTGHYERKVLRYIANGECTNAVSVQKKLKTDEGIIVSKNTIKRTLRRNGLRAQVKCKKPYLSKSHKHQQCFFLSVCPHSLPVKTAFKYFTIAHPIKMLKSSKNDLVDDFIRSQKYANTYDFLEWVEPEQFRNIKLLAKGGYGTIYTATWKDGPRYRQDQYKNSRHKPRRNPNETVALKTLYDSSNGIEKLLKETDQTLQFGRVKIYGLTKNPCNNEYAIVMLYYKHGDLRNSLKKHENNGMINILRSIIKDLESIHNAGVIHCDLHSGNILLPNANTGIIADYGLAQPAAHITSTDNDTFFDQKHDICLQLAICGGCRPKIIKGTSEQYAELMQRCWDVNPEKRPTIDELKKKSLRFGYKDLPTKRCRTIKHPSIYYSRLISNNIMVNEFIAGISNNIMVMSNWFSAQLEEVKITTANYATNLVDDTLKWLEIVGDSLVNLSASQYSEPVISLPFTA